MSEQGEQLPMESTNIRVPVLWRKALHARALSQGETLSIICRRALRELIEKEGISLY